MNPAIVVDVGNSRIKWGRCTDERVAEMAALAHDDEAGWRQQWLDWKISDDSPWAIGGVDRVQIDKMRDCLRRHAWQVVVIESHRQVPVGVEVDSPEKVGLDRLFNAVAYNSIRPQGAAGIIIGAGTAVTVDYVDARGTFRGGAILPGRRLMAQALHDHTAQLPMIDDGFGRVAGPGKNTESAIRIGITEAVLGAIENIARSYQTLATGPSEIVVTGGDAQFLATLANFPSRVWPEMTLEGIRLTALSKVRTADA